MTTRRRTQRKLPETLEDGEMTDDANVTTAATTMKSVKRTTTRRSRVAPPETPAPELMMTERVTRSRSRSLMRETPLAPAPVSRVPRLPRLDIQSEDEEEEVEALVAAEPNKSLHTNEASDTEIRSWVLSSSNMRLGKESWTVLLVCLVLLLLITLTSSLVEAINTDKGVITEAVVMVLAYALTPVRLTVETLRLIGASVISSNNQSQRSSSISGSTLDYDMIVDMVVNSDRFRAIVEQISSEKMVSYSNSFKEQLQQTGSSNKADIVRIESELQTTKEQIVKDMEEALKSVEAQIKDSGNNNEIGINEFETKVKDLEQKLSELKETSGQSDENVQVIAQEVDKLKQEIKALEEESKVTVGEIKKCCQANANIDVVIENKVKEMIVQLKDNVEKNYVTQEEVNQKLDQIEANAKEMLERYSATAKEVTKKDIEALVNAKVAELRHNIEVEVTPVATVVNDTVAREDVDVKKIVRDALTKYDADKTGLFDFALETAGGSVLNTKCTEPYQPTSAVMSVWGIPFWWDSNSPRTILQPGTSPGQCWAFRGSHGSVVVQLSTSVHITAVTIEHISSLLSPDGNIYSAPSQMTLQGVSKTNPDLVTPLLNFTYSAAGDPVQTFYLQVTNQNQPGQPITTLLFQEPETQGNWHVVQLDIHNNHGHPDYTCLYRFRVHGRVSSDVGQNH